MSFHDDFMKYFSDIDVVHKTPDTMGIEGEDLTEANHELQMFYGAWDKSQDTAGGAGMGIGGKLNFFFTESTYFCFQDDFLKNPQFFFSISDPDQTDDQDRCPVIISLTQRSSVGKELTIGFVVFKVDNLTKLTLLHIRYLR